MRIIASCVDSQNTVYLKSKPRGFIFIMLCETFLVDPPVKTKLVSNNLTLAVPLLLELKRHLLPNTTLPTMSIITNLTEILPDDQEKSYWDLVADYFQSVNYEKASIYAMFALIIHIITVNTLAVTTLTYGILTTPNKLSVHWLFLRRKSLSKVGSAGPSRMGRRSAFCSSVNEADFEGKNLSKVSQKVDCTTYPYLLSLAISDLLIGLLIAPLQLHLKLSKGRWKFGVYMCDLWRALDIFFCTSSALHTSVLAVDRWWTITQEESESFFSHCLFLSVIFFEAPMANSEVKLQRSMLSFLWILSAMISFPVMYLWQLEAPDSQNRESYSEVLFQTQIICKFIFDVHDAIDL